MISTLPLSKLLIWTTVLAPPTIVSMMYMRVINLRQNTIYRKLLYGLSTMGMFATSMLLSLATVKMQFEMWNVPEIVGLDFLMPLVEVGAVLAVTILCVWMLDLAATRLANDVANPLWNSKWKGSVKEKTTRLFFQLVFLWFIIGSFVNLLNYLSGHALLETQTWMHSFAWTVFLPALAIWWFGTAVRNTRKEIRKREDSTSTL